MGGDHGKGGIVWMGFFWGNSDFVGRMEEEGGVLRTYVVIATKECLCLCAEGLW